MTRLAGTLAPPGAERGSAGRWTIAFAGNGRMGEVWGQDGGMRKIREDSLFSRLAPEQRELLEDWLFEENVGYARAVARLQEEFGVATSVASVGRFFRRRARDRQVTELIEAQAAADELNALPVSTASLRNAAVKLVGKSAITLAAERPEQVEQLVSAVKVMLDSEQNEIRRGRLALAEKYFDFEATAAAAKELPQLRSYLKLISDDASLSHEAKLARANEILYGWGQTEGGGN